MFRMLQGAVAIIAVILFNFAVIGVFGQSVAFASLIIGIVFVVIVVVRTRTQEEALPLRLLNFGVE